MVVLVFAASTFAISFYSYLADSALQSTPVVALGSAHPGETVHVAGTIVAPAGAVVITGHYVNAGKSSHWEYWGTSFTIRLGNASLLVDASGVQDIFSAPHSANAGNDLQFVAGDHIEIIGPVVQTAGGTTVDAQNVAAGPSDFYSASQGYFAFGSAVVLFVLVGIALALEVRTWARTRRHADSTSGPNAFVYRLPEAPPLTEATAPTEAPLPPSG